LYKWRQIIVKDVPQPFVKKNVLKVAGSVLSKPKLYDFVGKLTRFMLKHAPKSLINSKINTWGHARDLPEVKGDNFEEWYKKRQKNE